MAIKLNKQFSDVVESYTNMYGTYTKYSDGRMECYGTWNILKDNSMTEIRLPNIYDPFVDIPIITGNVYIEAGVSFTPNVYDTYYVEKGWTNFQVRINRVVTGAYMSGSWIAKGHWK